ncbi:hypothetical protein LEP1GSC173_2048 [Leptospira interrogans str. HAI1594]|uniref:Uncharacterized protein n=1 Tax=Leptospira interrogans serovar Hardjo str. Norma TaxID=1279460 RepID=A0A0M4NAD6_LEPIR|nr:hypothetical protein G436_3052 [Leptospira interrogans serovar Hardjo str. Norma]EKP74666.1 hypothetical protein LEP1GSC173_2048 [Leptospira interrogans str. HAI1594]
MIERFTQSYRIEYPKLFLNADLFQNLRSLLLSILELLKNSIAAIHRTASLNHFMKQK